MNRREFIAMGCSSLAGCGAGEQPQPAAANASRRLVQSEITLHRHAFHALRGEPGANWYHAGNALSATSAKLWGHLGLPRIVFSRFCVAWTPNDHGRGQTGVRLVIADDGPVNLEEVCSVTREGENPVVNGWDVSAFLNEKVIDARVSKQLLLQTLGNGITGPLVYAAWLEIVSDIT